MQISRTSDAVKPAMIITLYGVGGSGKTTLAATAPKPIFIDAENGTKALKLRGIDLPVAHVRQWSDVVETWQMIKDEGQYETIVIDPVGVFLDLLITQIRAGGEMNQKKWGDAKDGMRRFIFTIKESGKHVIFVAHEEEKEDDGVMLRRPVLSANLSQTLIDMSDIVGHLRVDPHGKRALRVQPEQKYKAKDRYGIFGDLINEPNISTMISELHAAYDKPPFEDKGPDAPAKTEGDRIADNVALGTEIMKPTPKVDKELDEANAALDPAYDPLTKKTKTAAENMAAG